MEPTPDLTQDPQPLAATLPAPPDAPVVAPADPVVPKRSRAVELQPGHLLAGWGTVYWIGWLIVGGSFGAVWYSSRVTGLSTWWLGPQTEPRFWFHPVPFIAPFTLSFLALRITRRLPWYGIIGALMCAGVALGDVADEPRYALVEFLLAGAGLAISLASFAGMLRAAPAPVEPEKELQAT